MNSFKYIVVIIILSVSKPGFADYDHWPEMRKALFAERQIIAGADFLSLTVPDTIEDATMVPVKIRLGASVISRARNLYLLIDRNPDPHAMMVEFKSSYYDGANVGERLISTRVRINDFSQVRAILELDDGRLYMENQFVAGAGGCSAPPTTDYESALRGLGEIRVRSRSDSKLHERWRDTMVMVRHPNFSGMQPIQNNEPGFIPARFVRQVTISNGENLLMQVHTGISISENPVFRFSYGISNNNNLIIRIVDSHGVEFNY